MLNVEDRAKKIAPKPRPPSAVVVPRKTEPVSRYKEDAKDAVNKIFDKPPEKQRQTPMPMQPSAVDKR